MRTILYEPLQFIPIETMVCGEVISVLADLTERRAAENDGTNLVPPVRRRIVRRGTRQTGTTLCT